MDFLLLATAICVFFVALCFLPATKPVILGLGLFFVLMAFGAWQFGHPFETLGVPSLFALGPPWIVLVARYFALPKWLIIGAGALYCLFIFAMAFAYASYFGWS